MVFLKKAYQMVTVQGSNMHAKKDCINPQKSVVLGAGYNVHKKYETAN